MATTALPAVKLFGTDEPPAETRVLSAGPLTVELDAGNLRYIRFRGYEAIRAISYVVRDQYWGTFNPRIDDFEVSETADGFSVRYVAVCADDTQSFRYEAQITGSDDGTLIFAGTGTADTDFLTNRAGFVVLHPITGVAGRPVTVTHVDGKVVESRFPEIIDPKQPIMDIRGLTHEAAPGVSVTCTMEGDTFEMEDQRNWTDASYKTYVRPIGQPFPFRLAAGQSNEQQVRITFACEGSVVAARDDAPVTVSVGAGQGAVPDIGMGLEHRYAGAAAEHAGVLANLVPRFLSCYLDAREADLETSMREFAAVASCVGSDLALEAVVAAPGDLGAVAAAAAAAGARFESVAVSLASGLDFVMPGTVFPDTDAFDALFAAARIAFPDAAIGGGSPAYFTELNRKRPPFDALDFVSHTTCAIVHAADDRSVTETLECLPYVVRSGRALFGDRRYRLGPAGIGTRTSPFGSDPTPNPDAARVTMTRADPRQRGLLGAAWHLGLAARAAEAQVDELVLGAPVGPAGLLHHRQDYAQPWFDDAGGIYPVYHVARGLYAASGADRLATQVSAARDVQALAYRMSGRTTLWLANLTSTPRTVAVSGLSTGGPATLSTLDEPAFDVCATDPDGFSGTGRAFQGDVVTLDAYAVARIDVD